MKVSRVNKYDHKVRIQKVPECNQLIVFWDGFKGRHDYLLAEDLEYLDILVTELSQAVYNYKRKKILFKRKNQ